MLPPPEPDENPAVNGQATPKSDLPSMQGDGSQSRDFTYIANAVSANMLALEAPAEKISARVFNIACGERHSLNELYKTLASLTGYTAPPIPADRRPGDIDSSLASIDAAREALGYEPLVSFEEGLAETVSWHREQLTPKEINAEAHA
jgi:UDP-glucose 4-epimerase